ncbi:cytochrome P450 monooxygenase [Xylaria sp. FL1042]|nr:cytochrome P450 monooxygenase [Xylaria sp. FL1042]
MNETSVLTSDIPSVGGLTTAHSLPYLIGILLVTLTTYAWKTANPSLKKLPYINPHSFFSNAEAKLKFRQSAKTILQDARKRYPNQPYRMTTDYGEVVMLQSESFDEIRNNPHLSFTGTVPQERICEVPGFEPLAALGENGTLVQIIARNQLTKLLNQVTAPLSEEAALAVSLNLGESTDWKEMVMMPPLRDITVRMSSRVFLGEELSRNDDWLHIMSNYTVDVFIAGTTLSAYNKNLRPYIGWLFPECRRIKDYYWRARNLIEPIMKNRENLKRAALAEGQPEPVFNDALEWLVQESKKQKSGYDVATFQLIISLVATNTTTDLLHLTLVDLIQHPETLQAVRDEIAQVLKADGWKKTSLYNMKLLDSVIKESQRINPAFTAMRRSVEGDTKLSDGTLLKKGARVHIDTHRMQDPKVYENPEEWKGSRFSDLRAQPGKEHLAQLVTTSVDHFGFGHGQHACPGRFFAANELKIALCHLLIKYDWKLVPGTPTNIVRVGFTQKPSSATKVLCRRREVMELDIDAI